MTLYFWWPSSVLGLSWQIGDETSKNLTTSFIETIFTERGKKSFVNLFLIMEKEVVVDTSIFRENDRRLLILLNFRKIAGLVNFCLFISRFWTIKVNPGTLFTPRHPPPHPLLALPPTGKTKQGEQNWCNTIAVLVLILTWTLEQVCIQ